MKMSRYYNDLSMEFIYPMSKDEIEFTRQKFKTGIYKDNYLLCQHLINHTHTHTYIYIYNQK